ncbi:hypothetical protein Cri9333_4335 [Crinalium epipsammum PCC 9333]|uniref:Lipoprotein n=1 Tax=Crinalium epipsammum PCC 9333 TaxID=1173022 RepID=K9W4K6_9CYAN|nr:hypothetical protein [Crinalium epipsammum]AFZ15121.1 hypothetical protein Cri9333_4335 [Crinalium epipsammum PCC 9333]
MTKITQMKRLSVAALAAVVVTGITGAAVLAACTIATPDCPFINCDK